MICFDKAMSIDLTPPVAVRRAIQLALTMVQQLDPKTQRELRAIARGTPVTPVQVTAIYRRLQREPGAIALYGGTVGQRWINTLYRQLVNL